MGFLYFVVFFQEQKGLSLSQSHSDLSSLLFDSVSGVNS